LNKILSLSQDARQQGVIAASTGNHGLGVALAAKQTQVNATIFLPENASQFKKDTITLLGAKIQDVKGDCLQAELEAREAAEKQNKIFISPYNDPQVIAGQGTIGVELILQAKNLDVVFIAVGGGGLISGIGTYLKAVSPHTKIVACSPENASAMYACLKAQKIIMVNEQPTLSESTAGNIEPGSITFEICQNVIDECILVSEQEIISAMQRLATQERWLVEGATALALAAFLKTKEQYQGKNVGVLLCGRNIEFAKFLQAVS
jgi:threonine dehydratase